MPDLFAPDQHLKKMPIAGTEQKHKKNLARYQPWPNINGHNFNIFFKAVTHQITNNAWHMLLNFRDQ